MDVRHLFRLSVLFVLGQMLYRVVTQQCGSQASIFGWMLRRHVYHTMMAELGHVCVSACQKDDRCQSFNFVISVGMCEFSDRTKEARPEDFIPDPDRYYYQRAMDRVPLGSIPELPAETCKEIKASEGQAVSGKYWFSGIKQGMPVLAHCDMETEDINECSASPAPCDVNANCQNNEGSYLCSCKAGFTGDGKTCLDTDECIQGSHDCLSNLANCTNTVGSYSCSCYPGYEGDGKTSCVVIPECQNYATLDSADRKITYIYDHGYCDYNIHPGWYRFDGAAGKRMASSCSPAGRCGTHRTGWLTGGHPSVADGQVTRKVCFHQDGNCCQWSTNIQVRNCGSYYVYYLSGTPGCNLRYCGSD